MDEPKGTQDVKTSEETKVTSETPPTFTLEQATARESKAVSDALATAGRTAKTLEAREVTIKAREERAAQAQKDKDELELEDAREDKEKLTAVETRQAARALKSELADAKTELAIVKEKNTEAQEADAKHTKERNAREVATRLGVDAKTLIKYATDDSVTAMEELARSLSKKEETKPPMTNDTGKNTGGAQEPQSGREQMRAGWDEIHK